ncbi:MAG: hypothetical protein J6F30_11045 [Cellulosilyticum sp.]|nr:hypothetical protein [Cellulosilyticum sp.]
MYELPTEIIVKDIPYQIRNRGDYRMILDVFSVLEDDELEQNERVISALMIFYENFNELEDVLACGDDLEELVKQMYNFFNGDKVKANEVKKARKLLDWEGDSALISAAINHVSGKEIRSEPYIHWWTFLSYYMSVGESVLSTVISIRDKTANGKKLEKWEQDYKRDNPQYFRWKYKTVDEIDAENWLKSVWNKE